MKSAAIKRAIVIAVLACFLASPLALARDKKKADSLYPDTKRKQPRLDLNSQRESTKLNEGLDAINDGDDDKAVSILEPLAEKSRSKYARALALQGLANLRYQQGDYASAIDLMQQALDNGVLPNDTYFQLMYGLVQFYAADEQWDQALAELHKWRAEGKRETAESWALEGNINYRLEKYQDAVTAMQRAQQLNTGPDKVEDTSDWDQLLAASYAELGDTDAALDLARERLAENPDDPVTMRNTVSLLIQAQRYDEATQLMDRAFTMGAIQTPEEYSNLAKLHMMIAQESEDPAPESKKAWNVIEKGLADGRLQPGYDVYKLQGDAAYVGDDYDKALAAYQKAAPFATDGEMDLRQGQILSYMGEYDKAIKMIEGAIKKGLSKPGNAYIALGASNNNADHRAAAIRAMQKAAEYPETRERAQRWLNDAGIK